MRIRVSSHIVKELSMESFVAKVNGEILSQTQRSMIS